MNLKWTKADAKRAENIGFSLIETDDALNCATHFEIGFCPNGLFKSDHEAAEWVMFQGFSGRLSYASIKERTCYKAILLCCLGGQTK